MLRDDINTALKAAMKAHDARRVSTLRLINSALKNADIEARRLRPIPRPISFGMPRSRLRVRSIDSICGSRSKLFAMAPMLARVLLSPCQSLSRANRVR